MNPILKNNNFNRLNNNFDQLKEAYKSIRTNIQFSNVDENIKSILVTSSKQNEGKSVVISNLAESFSSLEKKIIIIDADLRNPTIHKIFGLSNELGLTNIITKNKELEDCVYKDEVLGLDILTSGTIPPNPSELLHSEKVKELIDNLKKEYDYIFIDSPPIGIVTDAGILASFSDGVIFVVGSDEVDNKMVKISKDRLYKVNANILGVILNKYKCNQNEYNYYKETD
ncbi:CpsD/CapB family tyrosine-protein kinase [[Clostridium] dakarense]|uniref:CpsD/CapB family tyrosine-protein kinase n=1 Tax=Faecalimicrobium dakarense TaxID=1301100 RepID=UPI0004B52DB6|nr:CpsD/CapB family tyrosine-protein kinase [[Clostridium] dakarense]